ncbi:conjugal transfer protein [Vagococcus lutrae]|uniref:conjugal transfer protein n=1 Tax=Vagococcus lutrae TaxID=81947 RepID=UPI00200F27DF|nr:conjugal transfer protein [Vagococcus lutrae]UQF11436.1 conjugal transfer protein [Vagococcus lutrae]
MSRRLNTVNNKIKKLNEKKAQLEEELGLLLLKKEELEDQEILAVCKKNNISLEELMRKVNEDKQRKLKEKELNEDISEK